MTCLPDRHYSPSLIDDPKDLTNAVALASSVWSATRVVGPAVGGLLIALAGPAICFYITSIGYGVMVLSVVQISTGKTAMLRTRSGVLSEFKEGTSYVLSNKVISSLIVMTFLNSIFGMSFIYLLPVFAEDILGVGPSGYGFLMTASGIGAICGVMTVASLGKREHQGRLLLVSNSLAGALLVAFSLSRGYTSSLLLIAVTGFFNQLYMTSVLTLIQSLVPDKLRGRVMGIYSLTWSLTPLGGMQAGLVADIAGAPRAVTIGGLVILSFAVFVAISNRRVRNLS